MAVIKYDPKEVVITAGGLPIQGFAPGTFCVIAYAAEHWTKEVGADGEVARARTNDDTGSITITLMKGSPSNAILQALAAADLATGAGVVPVTVTDLGGGGGVVAPDAWIQKTPDLSFGAENGTVEWVFDVGHLTLIHAIGQRQGL